MRRCPACRSVAWAVHACSRSSMVSTRTARTFSGSTDSAATGCDGVVRKSGRVASERIPAVVGAPSTREFRTSARRSSGMRLSVRTAQVRVLPHAPLLLQGCRLTGKPSVSRIEVLSSNLSVLANSRKVARGGAQLVLKTRPSNTSRGFNSFTFRQIVRTTGGSGWACLSGGVA